MMSEATRYDTPTTVTHALDGLQPDNLLAFLALLGLLRALETARPEWQARVAWRDIPPRVALCLARDADRDQVISEVGAGLRRLSEAYVSDGPLFDRPNLKYTPDEFRELALRERRGRERAHLLAALASDGATSTREEEVTSTPLCVMSGQGHQHFLSRLTAMLRLPGQQVKGKADKPAGRRSRRSGQANTPSLPDELRRALYEPWRYEDATESFRWDPIEDRRYAYQYGNPSESANKVGTTAGANRLAAFGLAALTSAPTASGLATLGVFGPRRQERVCWPLPGVPTSLSGYRALLAHPALGDPRKAPQLARYGVLAVARARRYGVSVAASVYFNFSRARLQYL